MKKSKSNQILALILTLTLILTAIPLTALPAAAATSGDFEYYVLSETDKACAITNYNGSATELEIPSEIDGYSVTSIGDSAFSWCEKLTSVTIPSGVTSIGESAFKYCTSLVNIIIPSGVTSIDNGAFFWCSSLASITIPDSVTSIGYDAFEDCTSLKSVTIGSGVTSIDDNAFCDCTSLTSVTIGNGVTSIGESAFYNCTSLTSVAIPSGVTSIGCFAFFSCHNLYEAAIPSSVTEIGEYAFGYTSNFDTYDIEKIPNFTICGFDGTEAERYAKDNEFNFIHLHTVTLSQGFAATCEAEGVKDYYVCSVCGKYFEDEAATMEITNLDEWKVIPATGHNWVVSEDGTKRTCTNCGAEEALVTLGDVNGDGKVSAVDARWALQCAAKKRTLDEKQTKAADMNGDGKITAVDARQILKKAAGKA